MSTSARLRSRSRTARSARGGTVFGAPVLACLLVLTGCQSDAEPESQAESESAEPTAAPEVEDFQAAKAAFDDFSQAHNEANAAVQTLVDTSKEAVQGGQDPIGHPEVDADIAAYQTVSQDRRTVLEEIGDLPAMGDPEVKAAHRAVVDGFEEFEQIQDSLVADLPATFWASEQCLNTFTAMHASVGPGLKMMNTVEFKESFDSCLAPVQVLAASENELFADFGSEMTALVEERREFWNDLEGAESPESGAGSGVISAADLNEYKSQSRRLNKQWRRILPDNWYGDTLPVEEFQAMTALLDERIAASD